VFINIGTWFWYTIYPAQLHIIVSTWYQPVADEGHWWRLTVLDLEAALLINGLSDNVFFVFGFCYFLLLLCFLKL